MAKPILGVEVLRISRAIIICLFFCLNLLTASLALGQSGATRALTGMVLSDRDESVAGVEVIALHAAGEQRVATDADGRFRLVVPAGALTLKVEGKNIHPVEKRFGASEATEEIVIRVEFVIPRIHESLVIVAAAIVPGITRSDDTIYKNSLFSRDDQLFETLNAGINAGQHEGGGKSLEIRRFGYNLDHGGVSGGLKVLVDGVQQNHSTQGHGQGYLGQLKSLTPELIQDVDILNGPFSAEYGDFSGLGVVHIRLKESLPDRLMFRMQGGSFDSARALLAYSPELDRASSFIAYEGSKTDGPFLNPLRYRRDNLTGNLTLKLSEGSALGFKLNAGRNDFVSSGQIPLDEVAAGRLDRFGFIDPDNGGRVRSATAGVYYRKERGAGDTFKIDGFVSRSLFDLFSNFTFFLNDEAGGDEIQQHDSRLQEGINTQYLRPHKIFGSRALLNIGGNFHDNQVNVGLYNTIARNPISASTSANAHVTNFAGYAQQAVDLLDGRLHVEAGIRFDHFRFGVEDRLSPALSGSQTASRFQPKLNLAYTPSGRAPVTLHANYGRGISSQDARGVVQSPSGAKISATDFYQLGASFNQKRFSASADLFLIDRSNEQVYIPDDGSIEFKGPSRAYGFEARTLLRLTRSLSFGGGVTRVANAFYRGTAPRIYLDSAPHFVSNAALTLADWRGFSGSLRYRHISSYRLDGETAEVRASGLDVLDFSLLRRIRRWLDFNLSIDNLTDKKYFETQNYFESRLRPGEPVVARIHATPGYPVGVSVGLTFHLLSK
jgi:hypothetical protein